MSAEDTDHKEAEGNYKIVDVAWWTGDRWLKALNSEKGTRDTEYWTQDTAS